MSDFETLSIIFMVAMLVIAAVGLGISAKKKD